MWVNANRTGPRSQQMCRHRCLRNIMEHCYNCSHPLILYPSRKGRFCMDFGHVNSTEECKRPDILVKSCVDLCKEDCRRMKFSYKVQETYLARYEVEAFSYIGGFIGIWLGVSLVQVVDVFESIFLIARYFLKRNCGVFQKT
ncbi:uncharacterized protein CDAR_543381 [Caerostris darwini]|uniref:Amiloride-sensitive sodium channel n=1 Tax=Caerostris darwini TaxID=1538125 RepID=A0AAV4RZT6_9ARAC|nr:uncharacterized protein CDAR_543381 [Caerostris darwini]